MKSRSLLSVVALTFALSLLLHASPCCLVAARETTGSDAGPSSSGGSSSKVAADLLKQGTAAMASGRFAAAISSFDEAIAADPAAYLTYYRRATAELSLGKTSAALADLDHLLTLKPDFAQAHFSRANVLTKEGELDKAQHSIKAFLKLKASDAKGQELKAKIETGTKQLKLLQSAFDTIEKGLAKGKDVSKDRQLHAKAEDCIKAAEKVLEISPNNLEARSKRAECRLALGLVEDAMADWSRIVNLAPSTELLLRLSSLKYYITGHDLSSREAGLSHLKSCLSSDPDNKRCARAHRRLRGIEKQVKKAEKFAEGNNWRPVISALKGAKVGGNTVIADAEAAIKADMEAGEDGTEAVIPPSIKDAVERSGLLLYLRQLHCRAHTELNELAKAKPFCEAVLARDAEYPWALVNRADQAMKEEKYEEAMRDYQTALEKSGGQEESIQRKLQKAQRLHKQANSKDYYKILGVSRDADAATIKKAYRKLAKQHHPDKGGTAEKMASLNEAFDVLNDDEKRAQFDQGVDPNDPMAQAQAQGGGFPGGGHPFMFHQGGGGGGGGHPFSHFFQQQQHFAGGGGGGPRFSFDF